LLLEAQVIVAMGTAGGVLVALWMTPAVGRLALEQFGGVAHREVAVNWQVITVVAITASACAWVSACCQRLPRHDGMCSTCCVEAPRRRRVS
jgi:hypothetical protein